VAGAHWVGVGQDQIVTSYELLRLAIIWLQAYIRLVRQIPHFLHSC